MIRRRILCLFLALLVLPVVCLAQAETQAAAQPVAAPASVVIGPAKLAWVNIRQAILECEEGKQRFTELQQFVEQKQTEAETMNKDYQTLQNQFNVQRSKLNPEALTDLQAEIETKGVIIERFQQDTQREITARENRVRQAIGRKMVPILEGLAKEKALSAVLLIDPQVNIYGYVDPLLVLTDEVVTRYNQKHPAGTGSAP